MQHIKELHHELEMMRPALQRFALLQLRNPVHADDVVQESLLAVLEKPEQFQGQSSLRTYVIGILKFKIIDFLRLSKRETAIADFSTDEQSEEAIVEHLFHANGHTIEMASAWGKPDAVLQQQDFFRTLELCLEKLPPQTARVFMMREWLELST